MKSPSIKTKRKNHREEVITAPIEVRVEDMVEEVEKVAIREVIEAEGTKKDKLDLKCAN